MTTITMTNETIFWKDSNGTRRGTDRKAITKLGNLYRGKGRPRNSDYLIDMTPKERATLVRVSKRKFIQPKKASPLINKVNAYIWTLVIGLAILASLTDMASNVRI